MRYDAARHRDRRRRLAALAAREPAYLPALDVLAYLVGATGSDFLDWSWEDNPCFDLEWEREGDVQLLIEEWRTARRLLGRMRAFGRWLLRRPGRAARLAAALREGE